MPYAFRYCEEKFISKYIPTIGIDYGVKPVKYGEHEVCPRTLSGAAHASQTQAAVPQDTIKSFLFLNATACHPTPVEGATHHLTWSAQQPATYESTASPQQQSCMLTSVLTSVV